MGKIKGAQFISLIWDLVPLQNIWSRVLNLLPAGLNPCYFCYFSFNSDYFHSLLYGTPEQMLPLDSRQSIMCFGFLENMGGLDGLDINLYNY